MWRVNGQKDADYTDVLELDLATVEPSLAGPSRPQDRVPLKSAKAAYGKAFAKQSEERAEEEPDGHRHRRSRDRRQELRA